MTQIELTLLEVIKHCVPTIARELSKMNRLKALELKGRQDLSLTPEMVDAAIEDKD